MFSSWAYVLIGNNNTGKTSFQRYLIEALCEKHYDRLPRNIVHQITHPRAPSKMATIFTANRSYQENKTQYRSVKNYFSSFFKDADICLLASHSNDNSIQDIKEIMSELSARAYNIAGIFLSNDFKKDAKTISSLQWQERFWIENPMLEAEEDISAQIKRQAYEFAELLIARSHVQ